MNGFKRASRRQAAVVGLAVLMGASFLGCHSGPRLFSRKDRDHQADKQELAEKDKGKFINRKKVRPESEYRRAEGDDERIAKSDSKTKAPSKPSDSIRKPSNDDNSRAVATRKPVEDKPAAAAAQSKTSKPSEQPQVARRDMSKRPVTDLLNDSLFDEKLPETRATASAPTAKKPAAKPATASKTLPVDEDPFKNSVVGSATAKRPSDKVSTVNFDDEDLDLDLDEMKEEAEELAEAKTQVAKKNLASGKAEAPSLDRRTTHAASSGQRKFLDEEADEQPVASNEQTPEPLPAKEKAPSDLPNLKRSADAAKTVAGQPVIDRRQSVQQTINDWRREIEQDESAESQPAPTASAPPTPVRPSSTSFAKGHLSPASLDEFTPPTKSQGAVLNGELIIDTNNLPTRFQRNASGTNGRSNANSGTAIEITPGATQSLARPAGQISLQSLSDEENSGVTTADYEQPSADTNDLGALPSLKVDADGEAGPRLASMDAEPGIAPAPPDMGELAPAIGASETPSSARGWKRTLLVLSAMISAIAIGFALRRRNEMASAPIQASKLPPSADSEPNDPAQWPRG